MYYLICVYFFIFNYLNVLLCHRNNAKKKNVEGSLITYWFIEKWLFHGHEDTVGWCKRSRHPVRVRRLYSPADLDFPRRPSALYREVVSKSIVRDRGAHGFYFALRAFRKNRTPDFAWKSEGAVVKRLSIDAKGSAQTNLDLEYSCHSGSSGCNRLWVFTCRFCDTLQFREEGNYSCLNLLIND